MFKMADYKFLFIIAISTEVVKISNTLLKVFGLWNKAQLYAGRVETYSWAWNGPMEGCTKWKPMVSKMRHRNIPKKHCKLYQAKYFKIVWVNHYRNVPARRWKVFSMPESSEVICLLLITLTSANRFLTSFIAGTIPLD